MLIIQIVWVHFDALYSSWLQLHMHLYIYIYTHVNYRCINIYIYIYICTEYTCIYIYIFPELEASQNIPHFSTEHEHRWMIEASTIISLDSISGPKAGNERAEGAGILWWFHGGLMGFYGGFMGFNRISWWFHGFMVDWWWFHGDLLVILWWFHGFMVVFSMVVQWFYNVISWPKNRTRDWDRAICWPRLNMTKYDYHGDIVGLKKSGCHVGIAMSFAPSPSHHHKYMGGIPSINFMGGANDIAIPTLVGMHPKNAIFAAGSNTLAARKQIFFWSDETRFPEFGAIIWRLFFNFRLSTICVLSVNDSCLETWGSC